MSKEVIDNAFFVPEVAAPVVDKKSAALPMINASLFTAQDKGDNPNNPFGDDFSSNPNAATATAGKKVCERIVLKHLLTLFQGVNIYARQRGAAPPTNMIAVSQISVVSAI